MLFEDLGLSDNLLKAIHEKGYSEATPIQEKAIPVILMTRDVLGLAQTGSGKTASFALPMIDILSTGRAKARMPRSLVLSPTRELAAQIQENFEFYSKYTKLSTALLVGGVSMDDQIKKLERGVDVLIATPGRFLDLHERGNILVNDIKVLVIDEADRMLDMGFIPDLEKVDKILPKLRQTLFFSATMPKAIQKLADRFLSNPKEVKVDAPTTTGKNIEQKFVFSGRGRKEDHLLDVVEKAQAKNGVVFCNRKRDIAGVEKILTHNAFPAGALHGDLDQYKRTETLNHFKEGKISFLVCSDVAARGIDIQDLELVINYDVPMNPEDYIHRIGRTGRAGKNGKAFTLYTKQDLKFVRAIENVTGINFTQDYSENQETEPTKKKKKERFKSKEDNTKIADDLQNVVGFGDDVPAFFK